MNMLLKIKNIPAIYVFLSLLAIIRFCFLGKGALGITDEWRYDESLRLLSYLSSNNWYDAINTVCSTQGRPADVLARLPDAFLQTLFYKLSGKPIYHPDSLIIPTSINVIITLIITFVFYRISCIIAKKTHYAIFATILYATLANNNLYIRHILPYDYSLLFFLLSFYLLISNYQTTRLFFVSGILTAYSFALYPGYYVGVVIISILFFYTISSDISSISKKILAFGLGAFSVALFFEALHQIVDRSYFLNLISLSNTIIQGSFDEGFIFIFRYLIENDYLAGGLLILSNLFLINIGIFRLLRQPNHIKLTFIHIALLSALACFIFHASMTFFFHKMVFYGRLIHFYLPFVVWATLLTFQIIRINRTGYLLLAFSSTISFALFCYGFYQIAYPRDIAANNKLPVYFGDPLIRKMEKTSSVFYESGYVGFGIVGTPPKEISQLVLVNFAYFYPLEVDFSEYMPNKNEKLIYKATHFQSFRPYTFEGFNPEERIRAENRNYQIKIYRRE